MYLLLEVESPHRPTIGISFGYHKSYTNIPYNLTCRPGQKKRLFESWFKYSTCSNINQPIRFFSCGLLMQMDDFWRIGLIANYWLLTYRVRSSTLWWLPHNNGPQPLSRLKVFLNLRSISDGSLPQLWNFHQDQIPLLGLSWVVPRSAPARSQLFHKPARSNLTWHVVHVVLHDIFPFTVHLDTAEEKLPQGFHAIIGFPPLKNGSSEDFLATRCR